MVNKIVKWVLGVLGGLTTIPFGREIAVFIISLLPILELRGGLIAASLLHLNPIVSYIICIIGNVLPVPFILGFKFAKKSGKSCSIVVESLSSLPQTI